MASNGDCHPFGYICGRGKKLIIAVEVQANRKEFDCDNCRFGQNSKGNYCDESNPSPHAIWVVPGVIESAWCLLPMVSRFSIAMLKIFPHWERGVMPLPGALLEQPQIVHSAMDIIAGARANLKRD